MDNLSKFDLAKYDELLGRGLCTGVGEESGQMCIEAAISQAMGLPFNDEPECVLSAVREYKIRLNDSPRWKSTESRASGMYDLGIAQLGSAGTVDSVAFATRMAELHIRELIPFIFRIVFAGNEEILTLADGCERQGTAAYAAEGPLLLSASICLRVLRELECPGVALLDKIKAEKANG